MSAARKARDGNEKTPAVRLQPTVRLALTTLPGIVLQLVGLWWPWRPGWPEVTLVIGLVLMAAGTLATVFALERYVLSLGRRDSWALLGLLGPLGVLGVGLLRPGRPTTAGARATADARPVGDKVPRSRLDRIVGLALSVLIAAGAVWAAVKWLDGPHAEPRPTPATLQRNELRALERLRSIADAQRRYAERDWDGDGHKSYADFTVHLWQSVDGRGNPVPVDFISRDLGFAMVPELALDGYVYRNLHWRTGGPGDSGLRNPSSHEPREPLEPERSWAVVAEPAETGKTGLLMFVVDASQSMWVMPRGTSELEALPLDPEAHGWVKVTSSEGLAAIQHATTYPTAEPSKRP